jgi:hypothetical protein
MRPLLLLAFTACGPATMTPELKQLTDLARAGEHRAWASEEAPHRSAGPHATVRTFVNPVLFDSLRSDATSHPTGSIAVKELFDDMGRLTGYAIDWKPEDGRWRFFEGFEPSLDEYFFEGTDNLCANCHRPGKDFVLTKVSALQVR